MLVRDPELLGLALLDRDESIGHQIGRSAELLISDLLLSKGIENTITSHCCPIDMVIPLEGRQPLGIEIKASFTTFHRVHLKQSSRLRRVKRDYCRDHGLKPYTILVQYVQTDDYFYLMYKPGIKRFEKSGMHSLYDFIEMVKNESD